MEKEYLLGNNHEIGVSMWKKRTMPVESNALVSRAKNGDMQAFEQLLLQHEKIVFNIVLRMMGPGEDVKDLSQEVFLKVYRNLSKFDEKSAFSTWIYRIAVNTCIDEMRRRKGKQTYSLEAGDRGYRRQLSKAVCRYRRNTGGKPDAQGRTERSPSGRGNFVAGT